MSASRATLAWAVLAMATLAPVAPVVAQEPSPQPRDRVPLKGAVVDSATGAPVAGALVWLVMPERVTTTDSTGHFVMPDVPTGPIELQVEQLGYESVSFSARLADGGDPMRVALPPLPVVLEGLSVMVDRLEARRRSVGVSVRTIGAEELSRRPGDMYEVLRYQAGLHLVECNTPGTFYNECIWRRGGYVVPSLYIDDRPAVGGLQQLAVYHPAEVYAVEIYRGGAQVRLYTRHHMERMARSPRALVPVWW